MEQFRFDLPQNNTMATAKLIRENFEALGRSNYTTDPEYPKTPRNGMLRIYYDKVLKIVYLQTYIDGWITLFQTGNATKSARVKEKSFDTATPTWVFDHDLGNFPSTEVLDNEGNVVVPESITHASVNRVIVQHRLGITGKIIVVG
jgi:hypothetical protein